MALSNVHKPRHERRLDNDRLMHGDTSAPLAPIEYDRHRTTEVWECLNPREPLFHVRRRKFTETHKWCPICEEMLPLDDFYAEPSYPSGRVGYCKTCYRAYQREAVAARKARKAGAA